MYKNNVSKKERKEKIHNILTTSLKKKKVKTLPLTLWSQKLTLPLRVTTLISKTTPPFCHEWQRVDCQVDISLVELASLSSSVITITIVIIILSIRIRSHWVTWWRSRLRCKAVVACRRAIWPTWTFTWYNTIESVPRRASMCCSCAMTSSKDTSPKEEGADADRVNRDGAEREEGADESVCRDRNWAPLRLTVA